MPSRLSRRERLLAAVDDYRDKGWKPVPLPRGQKWPPPKGFTGADAVLPDHRDYRRWEREAAWGNLALVMPESVIGYDVDVYHGGQLPGDMPVTARSTSRDDGSGISLFRVPPGSRLQGKDGPGIEIIQAHHRYAVVWPSLHPDGYLYEWLWPDDTVAEIPDVDELPWLPEKHLNRLQEPRKTRERQRDAYDGDWSDWFEQLPGGHMTPVVRRVLREGIRGLQDGSSRYDTMVHATASLVALGAQRHRGVPEAMDRLIDEYVVAVDGEPNRDPHGELERAIDGAVRKYGGRKRRYPTS